MEQIATKIEVGRRNAGRVALVVDGIPITARLADGKLLLSPAERVTDDVRATVRSRRAEILAILSRLECVHCHRDLDERRRCWKCCDRQCKCGRQTGSAFISVCRICEVEMGGG